MQHPSERVLRWSLLRRLKGNALEAIRKSERRDRVNHAVNLLLSAIAADLP